MNRLPALLLAVTLVIAAGVIVATAGLLPSIVPSHFGFDGRPDRWTPRDAYVVVMLMAAVGLPLVIAASMRLLRGIPAQFVNLPHRDYWLAPERREHTYATLRAFACSVGIVVALFMVSVHVLILTGAYAHDASSSNVSFGVLLAVFAAAMIVLLGWLVRRFARPGR